MENLVSGRGCVLAEAVSACRIRSIAAAAACRSPAVAAPSKSAVILRSFSRSCCSVVTVQSKIPATRAPALQCLAVPLDVSHLEPFHMLDDIGLRDILEVAVRQVHAGDRRRCKAAQV